MHFLWLIFNFKKVTLFGGASLDGGSFNDTWEWDDQLWTQVADTGPTPRGLHKIVYDSKSSKIVLFGGTDNTSYRNDTWEQHGTEWIQIADAGPPSRYTHSMVYNSSDKGILLFGGLDSTTTSTVVSGDTWKMKNNVWTKIRDMGPGLLYGVDMVYTGKRAETLWWF